MRPRFFASMILVCLLAVSSAPALAYYYQVHLDGVDNATWWNNTRTYLYVADKNTGAYYYQWNYGTGSLPSGWTDLDAMVQDLVNNKTYVGNNDWKVESGGNPFHPSSTIMKTLDLAAGTYTLRLTSDSEAYNLKSYLWPRETADDLKVWNAYVEIYAVYRGGHGSESFHFGGYDGYWQTSETGALTYYRSHVDNMNITLPYEADLYFYINDYNTVDNAKSVTLEIVPLPGSLALLGPGLALLGAGSWWRRKRS